MIVSNLELSEENRPGTSFTSKRQLKTQMEKRVHLQINPQNNMSRGMLSDQQIEFKPSTNTENKWGDKQRKQFVLFGMRKHSSSQKSVKIPKTLILHDQERLQEELLQAKQIINQQRNEYNRLRTKYQSQEEEIKKFNYKSPQQKTFKGSHHLTKSENFHSLLDYYNAELGSKNNNSLLIYSDTQITNCLKQKIKELKKELIQKEEMIKKYEKQPTITKIRELQIENQILQSETNRLTNMLNQSFLIEANYSQQDKSLIDYLRSDNMQMAQLLKEQAQKISSLQLQLTDKNSLITKLKTHNIGIQKINTEIMKELDDLKFKDPFIGGGKKQSQMKQEITNLRADIDRKFSECNQLNNTVMLKDKRIQDLEKRIKELTLDYSEKIENLERDRNLMKEKLILLREEMQSIQNNGVNSNPLLKRRTMILEQNEKKSGNNSQSNLKRSQMEDVEESNQENEVENKIRKRPTVMKNDVAEYGRLIRYTLREQNIPIEDLDGYLFNEKEDTENVSIQQIKDNLQKFPFSLEEQEAILIARYLVEDNDDKVVRFNLQNSSNIPRVRSILRNLLGKYTLFSSEEEYQLKNEISQILQKNKIGILSYLVRERSSNIRHQIGGKFINLSPTSIFSDALVASDIQFTHKQLDYLLQKNFISTNDLKHIDADSLFKFFNSNQQDNNQQDEVYIRNPLDDESPQSRLNLTGMNQFDYDYTQDPGTHSNRIHLIKLSDDDRFLMHKCESNVGTPYVDKVLEQQYEEQNLKDFGEYVDNNQNQAGPSNGGNFIIKENEEEDEENEEIVY